MAYDSDLLPSPDSGTSNATKAVALTGDQRIDGVLTTVAWGGTSIDYSFPTSNSVYGYSQLTDLTAGFFAMTATQQNAVRFALDADAGINVAAKAGFSVEGFTNLGVNFDSTPDTDQIRFANTTASSLGTARVADFPGNYSTSQIQDNGDVWFGTFYQGTSNDYVNPVAGNYAWHTHLHEIGHALGLKHGHENSLAGPVPANVDSTEYTVMTYRTYIGDSLTGYKYEQWGAPQTYMMLDIAALQHMYGADFTTNSGNTTYSWDPTSGNTLVNGSAAIQPGGNRIFATIWDGGGTDTYDLSRYGTNLNIDLTPGGYSVFSEAQLANLGGGPNNGHARGNIFNALQYQNDARSLIENAIGGTGNDLINGNAANNALTGNGGNDTLNGNAGNDTLNGNAGADVLDGGAGIDTVIAGADNDTVIDTDAVTFDDYRGGTGIDWIDYSRVTFAGANVVTINIGAGVATVVGGNTESLLGFENVRGSAGGETIIGGAGANQLNGMAGNDLIRGGGGRDILIGGLGNDTFDFDAVSDSVVGANCDVLQSGGGAASFDLPGNGSGGDRIDLSTIDANTVQNGNQAFIFGGAAGIGHVRCVNSGNITQVLVYVDNNNVADFQLNIQDGAGVNANQYTAQDFIL